MPVVKRHTLRINAASAAANGGDTGIGLSGRIEQVQWVPTVPDTGADIALTIAASLAGDTGGAISVMSRSDCLGTAFSRAPRQPLSANDGLDTGVDAYGHYVVSTGDRLRAKIVAAGNAAVVGSLHVWLADGNP